MADEDNLALFASENEAVGNDDLYSRFLTGDEDEQDPATSDNKQDDYKARFEQQKAEIEQMKLDMERQRQMFSAYQEPQQRQQPVQTQQHAAPNFDELVTQHGVGAAMTMIAAQAKQEAIEEIRRTSSPFMAQTAMYAIEQYRRNADFVSEDHRAEFDAIVAKFSPEQLATVDPRTIVTQLEDVDNLALGAATRKGRTRRAFEPPAYSRGSTAGGSGSAGKGFAGRRPSAKLNDLAQTGKDMGLDDKSIKELIKEAMAEGGYED